MFPLKSTMTVVVFPSRFAVMMLGFLSVTRAALMLPGVSSSGIPLMIPLAVSSGAVSYAATSYSLPRISIFLIFLYWSARSGSGVLTIMMFCVLLGHITSKFRTSGGVAAASCMPLVISVGPSAATRRPPLGRMTIL